MDSHDVAEQYEIEIAETKIKTNKEFIEDLKSLQPINVIDEFTKKNAGIADTKDKINILIKNHDYKIKEAQKELIQLKTESRFYGKDF